MAHYDAARFPVNTAVPSVEGTAQDGQTLTASDGTWTGAEPISFTYKWLRCDSAGEHCGDMAGATSSTYVVGHEDVGRTLRVRAKATNGAGSTSGASRKRVPW